MMRYKCQVRKNITYICNQSQGMSMAGMEVEIFDGHTHFYPSVPFLLTDRSKRTLKLSTYLCTVRFSSIID